MVKVHKKNTLEAKIKMMWQSIMNYNDCEEGII